MASRVISEISRGLRRTFSRPKEPKKHVAVVVPWSNREIFTSDEKVSLRHLFHYLQGHEKYLLVPRGYRIVVPGFQVVQVPRRYFGSASNHDRLLYKVWFYKKFSRFEFILFYHLDSLVISHDILKWCSLDFDYIGAPWIKCDDSPWVDVPRVGNGGLSMLRVDRAISVLANRARMDPHSIIFQWFGEFCPSWFVHIFRLFRCRVRVVDRLLDEWEQSQCPTNYGRGNDHFWSDRAVNYLHEFRVATLEEGLQFGFEVSPRTCFEMAGRKMPFGCHAWGKYDREFWRPFLLTDGKPN